MTDELTKGVSPEDGLPEKLFLEISGLVPIPNVDLFILDEEGRLLLTWRDDPYFGTGWHLPGGCIRFKETMLERIHKTAINELGTDVNVDDDPIAIKDVIIKDRRDGLENQNTRAHHLAVLYRCYAKDSGRINKMVQAGKAEWFAKIPENILEVHSVYNDVFREYLLLED